MVRVIFSLNFESDDLSSFLLLIDLYKTRKWMFRTNLSLQTLKNLPNRFLVDYLVQMSTFRLAYLNAAITKIFNFFICFL